MADDPRSQQQLSEIFTRHLTRGGNLVNAPVPDGDHLTVVFTKAEPDANYGVNCSTTWLTPVTVQSKTATGYTLVFDNSAGPSDTVDTMIFRAG